MVPEPRHLRGSPVHHDALYQQPVWLHQILARVVACLEGFALVVFETPVVVALRRLLQKTLPQPQMALKVELPVALSPIVHR